MDFLKNIYWKRWIRKNHCKLAGGLPSLSKKTLLILEEQVELGHVKISSKELEIGAYTYIRSNSELSLVSSIGRFCSIGSDVIIGQEKNTHPLTWLSSHHFQYSDSDLTYQAKIEQAKIGHDVWIGHSAMIMEGVTVGTGAVIATRAVVTNDVPPYAIVAGVPARVVKFRYSPEMIERLLASQWWTLEVDALKRLPLNDPVASVEKILLGDVAGIAHYQKLKITRAGCQLA